MSLLNRPSIPPHFTSISHAMGVYYIVHGLMLWLGCGGAGYFLWTQETLPLALRLALVVLFGVVSGLGMFFMALQGHEGFHGNLHSNRDVSMTMGIIASAVAPFFVSVGYNVIHWQHHLHTNTDKDPDYALYRKNDTFLARMLHGPRETMLRCLHNAWCLFAISGDLDRSYPFSKEKARRYAAFNVALMLLMLVAYVAVAIHDLRLFVFFVLIPAVGSQTYWAITPYIEHAGTGIGEGLNARTCTSSVLTVLLVGYTYHLCHHLYPRVQLHKLPSLYRYLHSIGYASPDPNVEPRLLSALRIGATSNLNF